MLGLVDSGGSTQAQFVDSTNRICVEFGLGNHINACEAGSHPIANLLYLNYFSHGKVFLERGTEKSQRPKEKQIYLHCSESGYVQPGFNLIKW